MKTFLAKMFICAVLWDGVCYADPSASLSVPPPGNAANPVSNSNGQNNQASAPPSAPQIPDNQGGSGQTQSANHTSSPPSANPPPGPLNPPHPVGFSKVTATAETSLPGNKTTGFNNLAPRPSSVIPPARPMFKDARNREPVITVIGGPAKSKTTAVINGTAMNHKPL
jgi:hypothetical protein